MKLYLHALCLIFLMKATAQTPTVYREKFRPQFHFSPAANWMNDPNGLMYTNGIYHLFYQHNPFANIWGHMSWGHATSKDLLHWQHLPVALQEENGIMMFSGSAVTDKNNTAGLGKNAMIAMYTGHTEILQTQNIAYSNDGGKSFKKYRNNPVLDEHKKDFRDPNVFWYEKSKCWMMCVSHPNEHQIGFYQSPDLKSWKLNGMFGPAGDTSGVWECPDLFELPVEGTREKKWVLYVSQNSTMQYFVGSFDGRNFINENPSTKIFKQDWGTDYYAAVTYHENPLHKPIAIGWVNNWNYANNIPTTPWKSMMSLPRILSLKKMNNEYILVQCPIAQLQDLRGQLFETKNLSVLNTNIIKHKSQCFEAEIIFEPAETVCGIELAAGEHTSFVISYNAQTKEMKIDRSNTYSSFDTSFQKINAALTTIHSNSQKIKWHIFFDKSVVEIFVNDGETVFTSQFFPEADADGIKLFAKKGTMKVDSFKIWDMKSVW